MNNTTVCSFYGAVRDQLATRATALLVALILIPPMSETFADFEHNPLGESVITFSNNVAFTGVDCRTFCPPGQFPSLIVGNDAGGSAFISQDPTLQGPDKGIRFQDVFVGHRQGGFGQLFVLDLGVLDVLGVLRVGVDPGSGGKITIERRGQLTVNPGPAGFSSSDTLILGHEPGTFASVFMSTGTLFNRGNLVLGGSNRKAFVEMDNSRFTNGGALVSNANVTLTRSGWFNEGSVQVTDTSVSLDGGTLTLGQFSLGPGRVNLAVRNGGQIQSGPTSITGPSNIQMTAGGSWKNSGDTSITAPTNIQITDGGSWINSGNLIIRNESLPIPPPGSFVIIMDHGRLTNGSADVSNANVMLTGSTWINDGGVSLTDTSVTLGGGSTMTATSLNLSGLMDVGGGSSVQLGLNGTGGFTFSVAQNAELSIHDLGSKVDASFNHLFIRSASTVRIANGGALDTRILELGGRDSSLIVTGSGSTVNNHGVRVLNGAMRIENGGQVNGPWGSIGLISDSGPGIATATVTVSAPNGKTVNSLSSDNSNMVLRVAPVPFLSLIEPW